MRGHLQERSHNVWRLKVYVGKSDDGRKHYLERTVRGSKGEAERALARLVDSVSVPGIRTVVVVAGRPR